MVILIPPIKQGDLIYYSYTHMLIYCTGATHTCWFIAQVLLTSGISWNVYGWLCMSIFREMWFSDCWCTHLHTHTHTHTGMLFSVHVWWTQAHSLNTGKNIFVKKRRKGRVRGEGEEGGRRSDPHCNNKTLMVLNCTSNFTVKLNWAFFPLPYCKRQKAGWGLGTRLPCSRAAQVFIA